MFARSLTLRTSGLFASIVLTGAMLGAIGCLAQTQHADASVVASQSVAPAVNRVPG